MLHHSTIISVSSFQRHPVYLSSNLSHSHPFPSGFFCSSTFLPIFRVKAHISSNKEVPIVGRSVSQVGKSTIGWSGLYRRISFVKDTEMGAERVLDAHVKEGNRVSKWDLGRIVKELRKFGHFKCALEVYEWMNNRAQKYSISTRDAAIQLDLIAKVRGVLVAEKYFLKLPDTLKDERTHGALLNAYVQARWRKKAESLMEKMKAEGYVWHSQSFNLMMSLYANLKKYDKVNLVASEMRQKNICLDTYSYNILLSSCGAQGSVGKMEQVFETMMESGIRPDCSTLCIMAAVYAKLGHLEKAEAIHTQLITRGYLMSPVPFNVRMTLYMNLKEYHKVHLLVSEMKQKNIPLDMYSYSIWLSCCVGQGSVENVENVLEQMEQDNTVKPNWITFCAIASFYMKIELFEKAEECVKKVESRITGRDRIPYNHVINLYGSLGKREEVYRVWNVCKSVFRKTPMMAYRTMIASLVRLGDIEGAELLYAEWLSVKPSNDPRVVNLLMRYYTRSGLLVKAEALLERMVELGGKPNPRTWEILAEGHIRENKVSEALSCLKEAILAHRSKKWKPGPFIVCSILSICEQNDDMESKEVLMGLLSQVGCCCEDEAYKSYIPMTGLVATVRDEGEDSYGDEILSTNYREVINDSFTSFHAVKE